MPRVYLAEFIEVETNMVVFQKPGSTSYNDAQKRLDNITAEYPKYKARVLASAFHFDLAKCQGAEMAFHAMFPKNFWLEEKLSGITECVKMTPEQRKAAIQAMRLLNEKFKKECFGENSPRESN